MPSDDRAETVARRLRGFPTCQFDWPDGVHGTRKMCTGVVAGEKDGKPACLAHMGRAAMGLEPEHMGYDDAE